MKENVPQAVGTPLINPYELRVRPAGNAPAVSDQLYGSGATGTPPTAAEYDWF